MSNDMFPEPYNLWVQESTTNGRITGWELFKHILRVQFTHGPYPPIKRKGRHRA